MIASLPKTEPTFTAQIYIAGDIKIASAVCSEWALSVGGCVTIEALQYVYTGGLESGVRVGFINYPRFPASPDEIRKKARGLADLLMVRLFQHSYSIVFPDETEWVSRRPA